MRETGDDLERLRAALLDVVERSGRSIRDLERQIGVGHGTLGNMFQGRTELRLRHLDHLCRALGLTLQELLAQAFDVPSGRKHARLRQLVAEEVRAQLAAFWAAHGIRCAGSGSLARVEAIEPVKGPTEA